jgi:hypothetical protein
MGVMTMKMINNTSMTSTIGVTLILEFTFLPSSLFASAILYSLTCRSRHAGVPAFLTTQEKLGAGSGDGHCQCPLPACDSRVLPGIQGKAD